MAEDNGTRLSSDLTKPQPTQPGDAPADTMDWRERASSAQSDKATAAAAGYQSVNAVVKTGDVPEDAAPAGGGRTATVTRYDQQGNPVQVTQNLDTGETTVSGGSGGETTGA